MIEHTFGRLRHFRCLVVRDERWMEGYWAFVVLAFILIYLDGILKSFLVLLREEARQRAQVFPHVHGILSPLA